MAINQASQTIATLGYAYYLGEMSDYIAPKLTAQVLCNEIRKTDAIGGFGRGSCYTIWSLGTEDKKTVVTGVYTVTFLPSRKGCFALASHMELQWSFTGPWYQLGWTKVAMSVADLKFGECQLHTRCWNCRPIF